MQSYTVAPGSNYVENNCLFFLHISLRFITFITGNSIDIATLAGDQAPRFYDDFDAVKVIYTYGFKYYIMQVL